MVIIIGSITKKNTQHVLQIVFTVQPMKELIEIPRGVRLFSMWLTD